MQTLSCYKTKKSQQYLWNKHRFKTKLKKKAEKPITNKQQQQQSNESFNLVLTKALFSFF